ncbi:MAG: hypothetical protein LBE16_02670, partial [Clostridiales Family XIII bacterium]|nr:hypothetical protein [Clostridiales Family XIII bacterium]
MGQVFFDSFTEVPLCAMPVLRGFGRNAKQARRRERSTRLHKKTALRRMQRRFFLAAPARRFDREVPSRKTRKQKRAAE